MKHIFSAVLLCFVTLLAHSECGIDKRLKIVVQKSYHGDKITVPHFGKVAGTVFFVTSEKIRYKIFLVDGTHTTLEVAEHYWANVSCGENPVMVIYKGDDALAAFIILEQVSLD